MHFYEFRSDVACVHGLSSSIHGEEKTIKLGNRIIVTEGLYKGKKGFIYSIFDKEYKIEFEYKPIRLNFLAFQLKYIE